jgi:hypothetical protein
MQKRKSHTTNWLKHLKQNPEYCHLRFKKLDKGFYGYPPFDIDKTIIDEVDADTFIKIEENRIPLFIGTQFGVYPSVEEIPKFLSQDKIVAILGKSLLSGLVSGLGIYKLLSNSNFDKKIEIVYFGNENVHESQ